MSRLVLVLDRPTREDVFMGAPLQGLEGAAVDALLRRLGRTRDDLTLLYLRREGLRLPECREALAASLRACAPATAVALGEGPVRALFGGPAEPGTRAYDQSTGCDLVAWWPLSRVARGRKFYAEDTFLLFKELLCSAG